MYIVTLIFGDLYFSFLFAFLPDFLCPSKLDKPYDGGGQISLVASHHVGVQDASNGVGASRKAASSPGQYD